MEFDKVKELATLLENSSLTKLRLEEDGTVLELEAEPPQQLVSMAWVASGHVNAFNDPLVEDKVTHKRYRADHLIESWLEKHPIDEEIVTDGMSLEEIGAFIEKYKVKTPDAVDRKSVV